MASAIAAVTFVLWSYPAPVFGEKVRPFLVSFLVLCFLGLARFVQNRKIRIFGCRSYVPFLLFLAIHWVSLFSFLISSDQPINHQVVVVGAAAIRTTACFVSFLFLLLLLEGVSLYSKTWVIILCLAVPLIGLLMYRYFFLFRVFYIAPYFDFHQRGYVDKNVLAFLLILIFPFAYALFSYRRNLLTFGAALLLAVALVVTFSRMALIGCFFTLSILSFLGSRRKKYILQLAIILVTGLTLASVFRIGPSDYLRWKSAARADPDRSHQREVVWFKIESARFKYLILAWEGFLKKPFLGHGIGSFGRQNPMYCPPDDLECQTLHGEGVLRYPGVHNDYFQLLYELGAPGLLLFLWLEVEAVRRLYRSRRTIPSRFLWVWDGQLAMTFSLFLSLLFTNAYHTFPFWFVLAGCYLLDVHHDANDRKIDDFIPAQV